MREAARIFIVVAALLPAHPAAAQISVDFRPATPGADELVMEWVAAPGVAGPFHLLRRELVPGLTVADLDLPLDPALGRRLENVTSPLVLSRGAEAFGGPGLRVYQVVSEDGACSQFAYLHVVADIAGTPGESQWAWLALPWRGGSRLVSGLMADNPGIETVRLAGAWLPWSLDRRLVARGLDGRPLRADDWLPPGAGLIVTGRDLGELVLVGAAEPSPRPLPAAGFMSGQGNACFLSPRFGQPVMNHYEVLCGRAGIDWPDPDGDAFPDSECPGPLATPPPDGGSTPMLTVSSLDPALGAGGVTVIFFSEPETFTFVGGRGPDLVDPTGALLVGSGKQPADPDYPPRDWLPDDLAAAPACRCADSDGDGDDDCTEELMGTDPLDPGSRGPDHDRDGVPDDLDRCPGLWDPLQPDADGDGLGDDCDPCPAGDPACEDPDGDGVPAPLDNCPFLADADDGDEDADGIGAGCDNCPELFWPSESDLDADGVGDACDNCPFSRNLDQGDLDGDGFGDACDLCPELATVDNVDADADGFGDPCDCAPDEPAAWGTPEARDDLRVSHFSFGPGFDPAGLAWGETRPVLGTETRWSVARGAIDALWSFGLAASAGCWEPARPDPDALDPDPGSWWYLVRAFNACGTASWGAPGRGSALDAAEPCP